MNEDIVKYNESTPFLDKLRADEMFNDENMLNFIKDFMKYLRRGSQTHLNSLIPLLQLADKLPKNVQIGNLRNVVRKEIQKVEYEEIIPSDL